MTSSRRRFTVSVPDWGCDHLSTEAVVAFIDGELAPGPHDRATHHLAGCGECTARVAAQNRARSALRTAKTPCLPSSLLSTLRAIPQDAELPPPPAGLSVTADGQLVDVLRTDRVPTQTAPRDPSSRRMIIGATAAVSGLALGALALGVTTAPAPAAGSADRGVYGGSVLGGPNAPVEAGLRLPATGRQQQPSIDHGIRSWLLGS